MDEPLQRACRFPMQISQLPAGPDASEALLTKVTARDAGFELLYEGTQLSPGAQVAVEFKIPNFPQPICLVAKGRGQRLEVVHFPLFEKLQVLRWLRRAGPPRGTG